MTTIPERGATKTNKVTAIPDGKTTEPEFINLREVRSYCIANFPMGSVVREMANVLPDEVSYDEAAVVLIALAKVVMRCRPL